MAKKTIKLEYNKKCLKELNYLKEHSIVLWVGKLSDTNHILATEYYIDFNDLISIIEDCLLYNGKHSYKDLLNSICANSMISLIDYVTEDPEKRFSILNLDSRDYDLSDDGPYTEQQKYIAGLSDKQLKNEIKNTK